MKYRMCSRPRGPTRPLRFALSACVAVVCALGCQPPEEPSLDAGGMDAGSACDDGRLDGDETGVDCGGSCAPCADGQQCREAPDCQSDVCERGYCLRASCSDGVLNGSEAGVDCGGDCVGCPNGHACAADEHCFSRHCRSSMCVPASCDDGRLNGDESGVDCGGEACAGCADGFDCSSRADCRSRRCLDGTCQPSTCSDTIQNQDETDRDCGGLVCEPCADGSGCEVDADCYGRCHEGVCISCVDSSMDGDETDVDCGGSHCGACGARRRCNVPEDCRSRICTDGRCAAATCEDGVTNGLESDVDCGGGSCDGCPVGGACGSHADCASGRCAAGVCQPPSCTDGVTNGGETDVDCGGPTTCPRCADFRSCEVEADCVSGVCDGPAWSKRCSLVDCFPFYGRDTLDDFGYFGCGRATPPVPCPDISDTGTPIGFDMDDDETTVPIGFAFDFYGTTRTAVTIHSDGALTFDGGPLPANTCLPRTAPPQEIIAVFWDDLNPTLGSSEVYHQTMGTAPNRTFVVRWDSERDLGQPGDHIVVSVVLHEGTNDIVACYADVSAGASIPSLQEGRSATIGISGMGGASALQLICNHDPMSSDSAIYFHHP